MVIKDEEDMPKADSESAAALSFHPRNQTAAPLDRFAASVIDYAIVLMPFIYLILAPFQRAIKVSAIFGTGPNWGIPVMTALAVIAVLLMIFLYQTFMVWFWGGTVGKLLLGLRVRTVWDGMEPRFSQAAMRTIFWFFSWLTLGIPFLAVFSNELRRAIHDRVSDTVVISVNGERRIPIPSRREAAIVTGIFWAIGLTVVFLAVGTGINYLKQYAQQDDLVAQLEEQNVLCEQVSDAQANWPNENGQPAARLSVALSLYSAGVIGKSCLQAEVENLRYDTTEQPLLDLAKSFVYADTPDLSDQYLAKVCQLNAKGIECTMSRWIDRLSRGKWSQIKKQLAVISHAQKVYPFIWAIRETMKHDDYAAALTFLQKLPNVRDLNDFITPTRVKLFWALGRRKEARGVEATAYSSLDDDAKLSVASFMCFQNIWSSCAAVASNGCNTFSQLTSEYGDALDSTSASLTYLRMYECERSEPDQKRIDYDPLLEIPLNKNVKKLVIALSKRGNSSLRTLAEDKKLKSDLMAEAARRLVVRTSGLQTLADLFHKWQKEPKSMAWRKVGEELFNKFYKDRSYAMSSKVGRLLLSQLTTQSELAKEIVSLRRSNQLPEARQTLAEYLARYPNPQDLVARNWLQNRAPASVSATVSPGISMANFARVVQFLQKKAK